MWWKKINRLLNQKPSLEREHEMKLDQMEYYKQDALRWGRSRPQYFEKYKNFMLKNFPAWYAKPKIGFVRNQLNSIGQDGANVYDFKSYRK